MERWTDVERPGRRPSAALLLTCSYAQQRAAMCLRAACLVGVALCLAGCMDRRLTVTSDPPGALVWLNDTEIGRTPVQTRFTWYGRYDVQLRLEGYETIITSRRARMPLYEIPPLDLPASALPIPREVHWHFELAPSPPETPQSEAELVERARELRERLQ
jgi:hypothetical protein